MENMDCMRKMEALVREDCKTRTFDLHAKITLHSCARVNGNIEAVFLVSSTTISLLLYKVIYFSKYNDYSVMVFKLEETFSI